MLKFILMDYTYDEIFHELKIFSKAYSQCHNTPSKWKSYKKALSEPPDNILSVHEIENKIYALVYRPAFLSIEAFQFDSIIKRTSIKRDQRLFEEILKLWKLLNPFHLAGISKQVYIKFYEFIHFTILNANVPIEEYTGISDIDAELDFNNTEVQDFTNFYDTLFENIDAYTKSGLVNEYCRISKKLYSEVKNSSWIKTLDLHNRMYSKGAKPRYPSWAVGYTKNKSYENQGILKSYLFTPLVSSRLVERPHKKQLRTVLFESKYEKMISPWNYREKIKHKSLLPPKTCSIKSKRDKTLSVSFGKTDNYNPIAKKLKVFKDRKIIEEIVKDRKDKVHDSTDRVLQSPLAFINNFEL
jgi:hypothetical protein